MKNKLVSSCLAAVACVVFAGSASALTYTYNHVSVPYGATTSGISGTDSSGAFSVGSSYVGQIDLNITKVNGVSVPNFQAMVYCLDLINDLASSDTLTLSTFTSGTIPHANTTLTPFQVKQIGALAYNGSLSISDVQSAATQIAIWTIEYGQYGTLTVNHPLTGIHGGDDTSAIGSLVTTMLANVATNASAWLNGFIYTVTLYTPDNRSSQDLGISALQTTTLPTPLPGALPLFASGLAGIGGVIGWRRKRKASATAAA
jgi:hypothetical protein